MRYRFMQYRLKLGVVFYALLLQASAQPGAPAPLLFTTGVLQGKVSPTDTGLEASTVKMALTADDKLIVSWVEQSLDVADGKNAHESKPKLILRMQKYDVSQSGAFTLQGEHKFSASNLSDGMQVLPSGRILIAVSGEVLLSDLNGNILLRKSIGQLCGALQSEDGSSMIARLFQASNEVGFLSVLIKHVPTGSLTPAGGDAHSEQAASEELVNCWFDPQQLSRLRSSKSSRSFPNGSTSGTSVYWGPPGQVIETTPEGSHRVSFPTNCAAPPITDMRSPYLLRSGRGDLTSCANGLFWRSKHDERAIHVLGRSRLPLILTDAWEAPVAVISLGTAHAKKDVLRISTAMRVVNYESGLVTELPVTRRTQKGSVVLALPNSVAVSNSGREIAILTEGDRILIYRL